MRRPEPASVTTRARHRGPTASANARTSSSVGTVVVVVVGLRQSDLAARAGRDHTVINRGREHLRGSGSAAGSGFDPSNGTRPHWSPARISAIHACGGVTIHGDVKVNANDPNKWVSDL